MLFNSFEFFIFLPIVFFTYWFVLKNTLKGQNLFLLLASYLFYGWWDWRFLLLILFSTIIDYICALNIENQQSKTVRKIWLGVSLTINLGMLGFFKYYNFFVESWVEAWAGIGVKMDVSTLNIILPVGISFYTFQTLSYTIDVFKNKLTPTRNFIDFAAFVTFFPQLVAGPIERASHLLPQFYKKREFNYDKAVSGVYLIIWGLFKKIVIADNCAFFVNQIFADHQSFTSVELWIGAVLFAFQIYGDFSGYSDIAIGLSRILGFDLMTNFKFPYFSVNVADFWRRWHISLSTWFRDYIYIPLGGSRVSKMLQIRNVLVIFLVSGFWHGANWTFVAWGAVHAILFLPLVVQKSNNKLDTLNIYKIFQIIITFILVTLAWVFFRADNIGIALDYLKGMFLPSGFGIGFFIKNMKFVLLTALTFVGIFILLFVEWKHFIKNKQEVWLGKWGAIFILLCILLLGSFKNQLSFIYFQF